MWCFHTLVVSKGHIRMISAGSCCQAGGCCPAAGCCLAGGCCPSESCYSAGGCGRAGVLRSHTLLKCQ